MSDFYPLRLFWDAGRGCAKVPGVLRHLTAAPVIPGLPVLTMIDYTPGVCAMVLPHMGHLRDLTNPERAAIHAWLAAELMGARPTGQP